MGKIEDCFGSLEEGQLFAIRAFEHPILRIAVEDIRSADVHEARIQAIAGIVVATGLSVPEANNIPEPGINIQPVSIASVTVSKRELKAGKALQNGMNVDIQPQTTLLIRKPALGPETAEPHVKEIVDKHEGVLTASGTPIVRSAMQEMFRLQDTSTYAAVMFNVSKIALSNIWHK